MNKTPTQGIFVAVFILALVLSALGVLFLYAPAGSYLQIIFDPYYVHVTQFSFYQALLSTLLSVGFAIPVAHALYRRQFKGKSLLLKLFSSTLVLPVLVGVYGLLSLYGNSGLLAKLYAAQGSTLPFSIYGLKGILLAHLFFNLPYACRLLLLSLENIPAEQHRLCAHLGMSHWNKFKWVEWPRMRQQLVHVSGLVFMLCFTSFATVMALGGGPKSTTIELAIYQAIKFDFDLQAGATLALWQMFLCGVLSFALQKLSKSAVLTMDSQSSRVEVMQDNIRAKIWDGFWIVSASLLVLPPLLMMILGGLNEKTVSVVSDAQFWSAVRASVSIALIAAVCSLLFATLILQTSRAWRLKGLMQAATGIEFIGTIILVTPSLVISTGLFLLLRKMMDGYSVAVCVVVMVNSLMALPYVTKTLSLPFYQVAQKYQMLSTSLGMSGWRRFYLVEWRALRRPITQAFAISFMLSMGDLSAIALFGSQDFTTLPLYLFRLMGSYQMASAAVVSLTLLLLSIGSFMIIEYAFRREDA